VTRVAPQVAERRVPAPDSQHVVLRRATRDDVVQKLKQQQREVEAQRVAQLKIRERGLSMKLTQGRAHVRRLAPHLLLHRRGARRLPRAGARPRRRTSACASRCGRSASATSEDARAATARAAAAVLHDVAAHLRAGLDQMAKQQQLSLNPSKLSGQCGRLKCCLRYELPNGEGVKPRRLRRSRRLLEPDGCGNCGAEGGCGSCGHHV
jgi:hypothetical protein